MVDNKNTILQRLKLLNLGADEAQLYVDLLRGPSTHLRLSRTTGINRSKVYRLVERLEKKSLVGVRNDDRGTFVIAADPATLEVYLIAQEEKIRAQREAFQGLLPLLQMIKNRDASSFIVNTYEGEEGFKQMLWHELKTKGENLILGCGSLNELVSSKRWIEQHHSRTLDAGYKMREIINPGEEDKTFLTERAVTNHYEFRVIPRDLLALEVQVASYNNTVSIYHWRNQQKIGIEVINVGYAKIAKQTFEHYWSIASKP